MTEWSIWHNPRCSKSRAALNLLEQAGVKPRIVLYLENPPSVLELEHAVRLLGIPARSLLRSGEAVYEQLGLQDPELPDARVLSAMAEHPILIERPLVIAGQRAVLGRPPERVRQLLDER
jgi:arsenate reductase